MAVVSLGWNLAVSSHWSSANLMQFFVLCQYHNKFILTLPSTHLDVCTDERLGGHSIFQITLKISPSSVQSIKAIVCILPEKPKWNSKCQQSEDVRNLPHFIHMAFRSLPVSSMNILAAKGWTAVITYFFFSDSSLGKIYWQLLLLQIVDILKQRNVLIIWVTFVCSVAYLLKTSLRL